MISLPVRFLRHPVLLLGLLCLGLSPAMAQEDTPDPAAVILQPGDALLIRVDHVGGRLPAYREIVDSDGKIEKPFLGFMHAAGKSIAQVEREMAAAYAEARLSTQAVVRITYITRFDPAPDRESLVRIDDPRRPVPLP